MKGLDPNYARTTCPASGIWTTRSVFELGERDAATGQPTSPTVTVASPDTTQACVGLPGAAKLKVLSVKGPTKVRSGAKAAFKVKVKNPGTATVRNMVVTATGGGKAGAGSLPATATKTVTVKNKAKGRKGSVVKLKFTVKANGVSTAGYLKVRLK